MSDNVRLDPINLPAPAPTPEPINRGYSTTTHLNGQVVNHETRHASISEAGVAGGSVASTLSRFGSHSVELQPGNPQSRTSVENAERMGAIRRDGSGGWMDVSVSSAVPQSTQQPAPQDQQARQEDHPSSGAYLPAEDQAMQQQVEPLSQGGFDAAVSGIVAAVVNDTDPEEVVKELARREGIELDRARELVSSMHAYHSNALNRALAPVLGGTDRIAAFRLHLEGKPGQFEPALQKLVLGRDPSAFVAAAREWSFRNAPDTSALSNAGFKTSMDPTTGEVLAQRGGGNWVRLKDLG